MRRLGVFFAKTALLLALFGALAQTAVLAFAIHAPLPERLYADDSTVIEWVDGTPAHVFLARDGRWRIRTAVHPRYTEALVRLEDKRFFEHGGVDWIAVARSAWINLKHGEVITGASTITMQLVRLLEKRPRTLRSKLIEALRARQLEYRFSKARILADYLRYTPYGRNVEGVAAGAWSYFGQDAAQLTDGEIATLLAVPQGPSTRAPGGRRTAVLRAARDQIAAWLGARMAGFGPIDTAAAAPDRFRPFPRVAPHAARWLKARHGGDAHIRSTLDRRVQAAVERALGASAPSLYAVEINNMAAIVVERSTRAVRALAATPHPDQIAGQVTPFSVRRRLPPLLEQAVGQTVETPLRIAANAAGGLEVSAKVKVQAVRAVPDGVQAFAQRDAWAVHRDERWVIVLWLGNLNHARSPALVDAVMAPVLANVREALAAL